MTLLQSDSGVIPTALSVCDRSTDASRNKIDQFRKAAAIRPFTSFLIYGMINPCAIIQTKKLVGGLNPSEKY